MLSSFVWKDDCAIYKHLRKKERAIKNEQLRETGNIEKEKQNENNTICVRHHYMQTNTNNENKT